MKAALWLSWIVALLVFADIAEDFADPGWADLENFWARPLVALRGPALTRIMQVVTTLADGVFLLVLVAALALLALRGRDRWWLASLALGSTLLNHGLKLVYARARPTDGLIAPESFSFPSGHTMIGMVVYGAVAYLAWRRQPRWAVGLGLGTIGVWLLVGASRIYLGAHYPGDVVAGLAAGWVCLWPACWWHSRAKSSPLTKS